MDLSNSIRKTLSSDKVNLGAYTHRKGSIDTDDDPFRESSVMPLFNEDFLDQAVIELRKMLAQDKSSETQIALTGEIAQKIESFYPHWFQRVDYPNHHLTSTSNHSIAYIDEGGLNTLGKRLTSKEASILRPWPKWYYLRPLLPELTGKSVLELGSSNGFFSFRFAELGASEVTGVEIIRSQYESAIWSASILGYQNVKFQNTDVLMDFTIPTHDIVFLSEVHNHFLFPFYGLARVVNLAKETVIFDTGAQDNSDHRFNLSSGWTNDSKSLIYHSFTMSDGLIMDFLNLIGIPPSKVKRYKAPDDHHHILYIIDTRDIQRTREKFDYPEYLRRTIEMEIKTE
ncbi:MULTISPECIES: methyltransferase domain-containing protein [Cyanophyceae]|uniref:class I SAM-dependent methyltransferase n=1 Tax=Cyanophyceae TaxID=3028117 RepID=UPI00168A1204|nr:MULTISPECIES: methyltransferase domain-containing protein [Cyanophyceae]MBD1914963.1 methyltransferase domain-containing protein [Phormidium sp. FACHB-77]MBD2032750.1 methyltransferase domain-containing protein [Phormidium sp. FACHB-322]MBD2049895.1 methyltransferase domain-containing protein [Leptolyngbya sp. FACHB-60]